MARRAYLTHPRHQRYLLFRRQGRGGKVRTPQIRRRRRNRLWNVSGKRIAGRYRKLESGKKWRPAPLADGLTFSGKHAAQGGPACLLTQTSIRTPTNGSTSRRFDDSTTAGSPGAEEIVAAVQRKGDLIGVRISIVDDEDTQDPWTLPPSRNRGERPVEGPLPKSVQITRANLVYVEKKDLPPAMLNRLLRLAAFQNHEFYKAQAMRLATYDKPRVIACGQDFAQHIAVPRGCLAETLALLESHKIRPKFGTNGLRAHRLTQSSRASCGHSRKKPPPKSPHTTKVSFALQPRSGRPPSQRG